MANIGTILRSIAGRQFGMGFQKELISNGFQITRPCVDAVVTVSDEATDVRDVTIQLKDADGRDILYVEEVEIAVFLTNDQLAYVATGGSTGIAIGTDGALLALVAKKRFVCTSEADGDIDLTWTDTGTEAAYIGVKLPSGGWVMGSQALTNT